MRIAILNQKGGAGKTAIATTLGVIQGFHRAQIDQINEDFDSGIAGSDAQAMIDLIENYDDLILDVGASEYKDFIVTAEDNDLLSFMDKIIIPISPDNEVKEQGIQTCEEVVDMGFDPSDIVVAYTNYKHNRRSSNPLSMFDDVHDLFTNIGVIKFAEVRFTNLFDQLKAMEMDFDQALKIKDQEQAEHAVAAMSHADANNMEEMNSAALSANMVALHNMAVNHKNNSLLPLVNALQG